MTPELENVSGPNTFDVVDGLTPDLVRVFFNRTEIIGGLCSGLLERLLGKIPTLPLPACLPQLPLGSYHDFWVSRELQLLSLLVHGIPGASLSRSAQSC
jgi:hypothetical protein